MLRKEKDIEVCAAYLRSDFRKEAPIFKAAADDICRRQPTVLIHSQMIIREEIAKDPKSALKIRDNLPHEAKLSLLSHREMEILGLISRSNTNMDIGKKLFISEKTVKTHIKNIFEKLGVGNRVEGPPLSL